MKDTRTLILIIIVLMGLAFLAIATPGVADRLTLPGLTQPTPLVTVVVIIQNACGDSDSPEGCYKPSGDLSGSHSWQTPGEKMPDDN